MGLAVHTQDVSAHLVGHPVEVTSPPAPASDLREIHLKAGARDDGVVGCSLALIGTREQLRKMFEDALLYV